MTTPNTLRGWLKRYLVKALDALAEKPWMVFGLFGRSALVIATVTLILTLESLVRNEVKDWIVAMTGAYGG